MCSNLKLDIHKANYSTNIFTRLIAQVSVDVLRRKIVILFISDLDLKNDELMVLSHIYNDTQHEKSERNYEIVWVPVVDKPTPWTDAKESSFHRLASSMPWYSLSHPTLLEPAVFRYIKEVWLFVKKPLLVVLDAQGRLVCSNALHMMWIWGSVAFPFTSLREETLWKEVTWKLEFLVDDVDPRIHQWVCIYLTLYFSFSFFFNFFFEQISIPSASLWEQISIPPSFAGTNVYLHSHTTLTMYLFQ